jgi:DNA-binding winged helix-turn-helix (wHTH) protein/tetratricopeptide (TPR) repeat protein
LVYLFQKFVLSEEDFALTREGTRISLEPKSLRVLILLVAGKGKLISKQKLLDEVWKGTIVEETALTRAVALVRKQLGDDPRQPQFIETVPTVGYRFIATVEERATAVAESPVAERTAQIGAAPIVSRPWIWISAAALVAVGLTVLGIASWTQHREAETAANRSRGQRAQENRPAAAYDGYLQGRYLLNKRDMEGALPLFRRAIVLDPNYAQAWAGLAVGLAESGVGSSDPLNGTAREAKAAARHALELDPKNGEAWSALGLVALKWEWDWKGAEQDLQRAIALSPGDSTTEWRYATYLSVAGRHDEAVAHMRQALKLDPMTFMNVRQMGSVLYWARRYDEAIEYFHRAEEMEPDRSSYVSSWESSAYEMKGLHDRAVAVDLKLTAPEPGESQEGPNWHARLESAYRRAGWKAYWEERLRMIQSFPYDECGAFDLAAFNTRIGRNDEAFRWLDRGVNERCFMIPLVATDPSFDGLRGDARYRVLLRQLHLDQ